MPFQTGCPRPVDPEQRGNYRQAQPHSFYPETQSDTGLASPEWLVHANKNQGGFYSY